MKGPPEVRPKLVPPWYFFQARNRKSRKHQLFSYLE